MTDQAPVPGFPSHMATSDGQIIRVTNGKGRAVPGLRLKQTERPNGYMVVSISGQKHFVHRLVCMAFHGKPDGLEVSHENGRRSDNRAENLKWRTHQENVDLTVAHGTRLMGEACHMAKLTDERVIIIRSAHRQKIANQKQLADFFKVSRATVGDVINNRTWRHAG